jgi:hypothetical protein
MIGVERGESKTLEDDSACDRPMETAVMRTGSMLRQKVRSR